MNNKSGELVQLFKRYLERKEKEKVDVNLSVRQDKLCNGCIYFYEWSDITREPLRFHSGFLFEKFLEKSGIPFLDYHRDVMKNKYNCYITCRPGSKELIIRARYDLLEIALKNIGLVFGYSPGDNNNISRGLSPIYRT